jgi:uncharacterized protein (TIGR03437 family)
MRPGQWSAEFRVDAGSPATAETAVITAQLGSGSDSETLAISSAAPEKLIVPHHLFSMFDHEVKFQLSKSADVTTVSVDGLPPGASFDPVSLTFDWTPNSQQLGTYILTFTAAGAVGDTTQKQTRLEVDPGTPVIARIIGSSSRSKDAVCSSGSLATIEGRWLQNDASSTVRVDGLSVRLISAFATHLEFQCPDLALGATHTVAVETALGTSVPVQISSSALTPGIFSIDKSGSGQGFVTHSEDSTLATLRNYTGDGRPAQSGDQLVINSTGISGAMQVLVNLGGIEIKPDSITESAQHPGIYQIAFSVPQGVSPAESVSLFLTGLSWDGSKTKSNTVTIAVEN